MQGNELRVTATAHHARMAGPTFRKAVWVIALAALALAMVACGLVGQSDDESEGQMPPTQTDIRPSLQPRDAHTATLLEDGRVLITGGFDDDVWPMDTVEVFDPKTGVWNAGSRMSTARAFHAATRLGDGRVLITGGLGPDLRPLASAEVWDPETELWSPYLSMAARRRGHTSIELNDGRILITGRRWAGWAAGPGRDIRPKRRQRMADQQHAGAPQ